MWSGGESRGPTPVSDTHRVTSSDNLMYIKFVRDITEEVLEKGIFTNKALKKIFQNHVEVNKQFLDMRRMQEEVDKLQLELGIPNDDGLDKDNYGVTYRGSEEKILCSKVEDKELLEALSQLNISSSLKADIANSLGLFPTGKSESNVSSSESLKQSRNSKRATFSSPLEVIYDINQKEKFPQSDDDSYEMLSEGSESRPLTPLGLAW
ncbi:spermatogenesis-associated protein 7 homolog [Macrosteles quadrilineatus]|uniref:spermatogenesis-associated protein 7 homolog n=1 Tax=Macrosteles quadrilineatus TaxID=74068 RepID=UPI0023E34C7D|nr:spermatogenesis-associated protein 7 homolog [Macrosteles quadrilineatus]